jgi:hypothetical protein
VPRRPAIPMVLRLRNARQGNERHTLRASRSRRFGERRAVARWRRSLKQKTIAPLQPALRDWKADWNRWSRAEQVTGVSILISVVVAVLGAPLLLTSVL